MAGRSSLVSASRARRKKRLRVIRGIFIVIFFGLLGFGVYWLLTSDVMQVNGYRIVFADNKTDMAVESVLETRVEELLAQPIAAVIPRTHLAAFWPSLYEQSFAESDPRIEKVDISRTLHDATITVTLRGPYASWCGNDMSWCVVVDATGRVVDANRLDDSHIVITTPRGTAPKLGTAMLESDQFITLYKILQAAETIVGRPDVVVIATDETAVMNVPDMTQIKILLDESAESTNKYLGFFAERIKSEGKTFADFSYVDLRFGNAVYYMTRHGSQNESLDES